MLKISLRAARINKELTQKDVANEIGVSPITIARWEKGETAPDAIELNKLCVLYGLSMDNIFLSKKFA